MTKELQLLMRHANISVDNVHTQLQQRASFQMREYLRVTCYRLDRDQHTTSIDAHHGERIRELLRIMHAAPG
jgi:hypothetical protein